MVRSSFGALLLAACSATAQVEAPPAPSVEKAGEAATVRAAVEPQAATVETPEPAAVETPEPAGVDAPEPNVEVAALRAALPDEPVVGFVRLSAHGRLFSSRELANKNRLGGQALPPHLSQLKPGDSLLVLEDLGSVLRVSTQLGSRVFERAPDPQFEFEAFVRKSAVAPVLRRPLLKTSKDGTGYVLREGLKLALSGDTIVPNEGGLEDLAVTVTLSDVGLGFQPIDEPPTLPALADAKKLGCEADGVKPFEEIARAQVDAERLRAAEAGETGGAIIAINAPCSLNPKQQAALSVLGQALLPPSPEQGCHSGASVTAHRVDKQTVLAALWFPRATVRARTAVSALQVTSCYSMPYTKEVGSHLVAKAGTVFYFADGSVAGSLKYGMTVAKPGATGRVCVEASSVEGGLCFKVADLVERTL